MRINKQVDKIYMIVKFRCHFHIDTWSCYILLIFHASYKYYTIFLLNKQFNIEFVKFYEISYTVILFN
jgi:hypothetical protein